MSKRNLKVCYFISEAATTVVRTINSILTRIYCRTVQYEEWNLIGLLGVMLSYLLRKVMTVQKDENAPMR